VGEDGKRYLFLNGVSRVRLSDDGLATVGAVDHVYNGWKYPADWITEAYALEGPKLTRHGGYFYLISAVGGTAGPATSHMVIAARSKSIDGPWENCPANPIVHTKSATEYWWSRGNATLVEGPAGDWWMVYHAYENGYRTLGRQTLLEPIAWTADGWFKAVGGDLSKPLLKPKGGRAVANGIARSDDFAASAFGTRWSFYEPEAGELKRARLSDGSLILQGKGTSPSNCSPLTGITGDHAYEVSVALELDGDATGGLLLFFNKALFIGIGIDGSSMTTYKAGRVSFWHEDIPKTRSLHMRIVNNRHIVNFQYSLDGSAWTRHGLTSETSGYNVNVADDLWSLRPALFATGSGAVRFRDFRYRALA
jgi:xylan 1,4-beta-xylosidase